MKYILKYHVDKNNVTKDLLYKKGIDNPKKYINIDGTSENSPSLLDNIDEGCNLLIKHLNEGHSIYLQPDSDLDGYMSASILYNYIKLIWPEANIIWKVHEGKQHGIIIPFIPEEVDLAIFPDAGTNNIREHEILRERGTDVLVIDHHQCDIISDNACIINNQMCNYPNKYLSGGGVTYKFIQQMDKILGKQLSEQFIDLAAVSIIGDMMDLRDYENRYIIKKGLANIQNIGLKQLIEQQSYSIGDPKRITPILIAFYIVPLVNAIVRVGTESEKSLLFEAFINGHKIIPSTKRGDKGNFETIAQQAARNCVNARSRQNRLKEKAIDELDSKIRKNELFRNQVIFVNVEDNETFDSTLTGLIAMNFLSKYKKPTIVARLNSDGYWRGSARGSNATELKDLKSFFSESKLFEFVEGHPNAFGISIHTDNVEKLVDYANKQLKDVEFNENVYEVDLVYSAKENFAETIVELDRLRTIWGQGIEEPLIVVEDIKLFPDEVSFIGQNKDTVKFTNSGVAFVKFKDPDFVEKIKKMKNGFSITVLGKANMYEWNGNFTPQLMLEDYLIKDTSHDF